MTGPNLPVALGFVRQDVSGDREWRDEKAISEWAARYGYHLAMVVIGPGVKTPGLILIQHIRDADAAAVIVATADHIWESRRAITPLCDLVIVEPEQTWVRGHRWPPISAELSPRPNCLSRLWGR